MNTDKISLAHGGGGQESEDLIKQIRQNFRHAGKWRGRGADAAVLSSGKQNLVFTTDSYIVSPLFFPGGDIGKLSICGTINDLAVIGAKPLGISLSIILEEGFAQKKLSKIIRSISKISGEQKIPIVTGDTKVMQRGKIDGIVINTSGVGQADNIIHNSGLKAGDAIIASGRIGDHGAALLAERFNYQSSLKSDCQPIWNLIKPVKSYLTACKDPTRGGLSAVLYEMARKAEVRIILDEQAIPIHKQTRAICDMLGLSPYHLASEGCFIVGVKQQYVNRVLRSLKKQNKNASVIGVVKKGRGVGLKNDLTTVMMPRAEGKLVPRIC
ncbi:hydrogenase expression/formation protein HypE [Patescibacteria group bacterium]